MDMIDESFKTWEKMQKKATLKNEEPELKLSEYEMMKHNFVKKVFSAFPQLAVMTVSQNYANENPLSSEKSEIIENLTRKFLKMLRTGLNFEAASERTINKFRNQIDLSLTETETTDIIASDLNGMCLMDYMTLEKLRESDLKTRRVYRDKALFEMLGSKTLEYDDSYEPNYSVLNETAYKSHKEKVEKRSEEILSSEYLKEGKKELDDFVGRSKALMWRYYDQTLREDKITGMSNEEMIQIVFNTPTIIENAFASFVKTLETQGVYLSGDGLPLFQNVKDVKMRQKLENKADMCKFALMQRDMKYGHKHQLNMVRKALELQVKIKQVNKEASEDFQRVNEQNLRELAEKLKLSKSETDDLLGFVYYEQHDREKKIKREPLSTAELGVGSFLKGVNGRIDWNQDFKDSIFERNLKLEAEWLKVQTLAPSTGVSAQLKLVKRMSDTIQSLRRVRFQFDKKAVQKVSKIFFLEHLNFDFENEKVDIEKLEDYFKIPSEVFVKDPHEDHEFQKSKKSVQKKMLVFDLEDPLRSGSHDGIEENQAENVFWEEKRMKDSVKINKASGAASLGIDLGMFKALQMNPEERKKYIRDNHITDISLDPLGSFLQNKWEMKKEKKIERDAEKKKAGLKKKGKKSD